MPTQPVATTMVQIDRIHPNPNQPRKYFDPQAIQDLKDSMEKRGLINPISVVKSGESNYTIIAGERRYRAACELKWDQIDCRMWPAETTSQEVEMLSLVENLQRADLNPIEVANGYKLLTQPPHNMTQVQIAEQVGKTQQAIGHYLTVSQLEPQVQEITNRLVNLGLAHLMQICRLKTPQEQIELAKKASEGEWTVKKLAAEVTKSLGKRQQSAQSEQRKAYSSLLSADGSALPLADPLAALWPSLLTNPQIGPQGTWKVQYLGGAWQFWVSSPEITPQADIKRWFEAMNVALSGASTNEIKAPVETPINGAPETLEEFQQLERATQHVQVPSNLDEKAKRELAEALRWVEEGDKI